MGQSRVTLFRPVGQTELDLITAAGCRAFPPRLPHQPIFYPVTSEAYAAQIARDEKVPAPLTQLAADLCTLAHRELGEEADHVEAVKVIERWADQEVK